ncbi:hypothetical protein SDC9_206183 [bioreactor metagenome]|uniref:Uncharacterized protein n=1 Tax=bioreactor metagenome TaxID=1076179 RepID=A0A645J4A5_9ZZZZ
MTLFLSTDAPDPFTVIVSANSIKVFASPTTSFSPEDIVMFEIIVEYEVVASLFFVHPVMPVHKANPIIIVISFLFINFPPRNFYTSYTNHFSIYYS